MTMPNPKLDSGFAPVNGANIYYETAGQGAPFVMIHAGVADSRQWTNEFAHFAEKYRVLRYDLRGYGKSEPVEGDFSHMKDLTALLDHLGIDQPAIFMGCSMGGGLSMDFALAYPARARALIMAGSAPSGLKLDVPNPPKFEEVEKAFDAGDLERACELEVQIWFDGDGRSPEQVDPAMRKLAWDMNRLALAHETKNLGKRQPDAEKPAVEQLDDLKIPVLVVTGVHDTPYILAASDFMAERLPNVRREMMADAAHLPNLDHPDVFQALLASFLDEAAP
jgi:pimeloyl-ACP methyl ester carboxylesterase